MTIIVLMIIMTVSIVECVPNGIHSGYTIQEYATGLYGPRGLFIDSNGNILVVTPSNVWKVCF